MTVEDYEARRIIEELRRDHAPAYDWDTFDARLTRCVKEYADRRTIQAHMVRAVAELAYGYVAEQLAATDREQATERDAQVAKLEGVIERLEEHQKVLRSTNAHLTKALNEKHTIREEREAARGDGDTQVTIRNDYKGWTVAMLEEVAYRLRSGGAVDGTPVDVDQHRAVADVPAPNTVTLEAPTRVPNAPSEPHVMPLDPSEFELVPRDFGFLFMAGAVVVGLVAALMTLGAVIW